MSEYVKYEKYDELFLKNIYKKQHYQTAGACPDDQDCPNQQTTDEMSPVSAVTETATEPANNEVNVNEIVPSSTLQPMQPSQLTLYTIPAGTKLYYGSLTVDKFPVITEENNEMNIVTLGNEGDPMVAFFSPDKKIASTYIKDCVGGQDSGYIHEFIVKKDITDIFIISPYNSINWDETTLNGKFCAANPNVYANKRVNGVGMFLLNEQKNKFESEGSTVNNSSPYSCQFALCDPNTWLSYNGTSRCISQMHLSDVYRFDK